jgi:hypothetical protein
MVLTVAPIAYLLMITMHVNTWNANAIKLIRKMIIILVNVQNVLL